MRCHFVHSLALTMPSSSTSLFWLATAGFIAVADALLVCRECSILSCRSANQCSAPVLQLSSHEEKENASPEYRSIAEVVGGLHGGKYEFGGDVGAGVPDSAFSGQGSCMEDGSTSNQSINLEDLPNWAKRLAPSESQTTSPLILSVPSNANPMDGLVYFASVDIQNQERTWEKFYAKLMVCDSNGVFVDVPTISTEIVVSPLSGSLAPRGGASNACDASKPYSDKATIRVTQSSSSRSATSENSIWLVIGTEEEKWVYKLELL